MNWVHALVERVRHARRGPSARLLHALGDVGPVLAQGIEAAERTRRRRVTPSGLIAGVGPEMSPEQRAYLLAGIIGRDPHDVLAELHGPSVAPPSPVNRYLTQGEHCSCWQYGGTCCSCRQGDCPANLGYQTRRFRRQEWEGRWTPPEEPSERRLEELSHHARQRRRFSERPSIDPFPSRRGTW